MEGVSDYGTPSRILPHVDMMSPKHHLPSIEAATPRTAEEIMCVMGDVTLMDKRLAMDIRNPKQPCPQ